MVQKIRKAVFQDLSRIAEILVFVKRVNYRPIFKNDAYSFGELQVLSVAEKYAAPDILNHIWVYDDGIVKGMIHIEGREIRELYVEEGTLFIKTSPVEKIYVATQGRNCYRTVAAPGETITEAAFKLTGLEGYIRVDCQDGRGLHANTNAYEMNGTNPFLRAYDMIRW